MIELLEALADAGAPREQSVARRLTRTVLRAVRRGRLRDLRQREAARPVDRRAWGSSGLIDLDSYRATAPTAAFIDVVPFGLRDAPPLRGRPGAQGRLAGHRRRRPRPALGRGHLALARRADSDQGGRAAGGGGPRGVHLFFMGVERPGASRMQIPSSAEEAIAYARERGLEGRCVHFNHGWVPYDERQSYLLEADLGISAHHDHLEARFSFRTRVLDYLWAGLPMVLTRGDSMADLAERRRASARRSTPRTSTGFAAACAGAPRRRALRGRHGRARRRRSPRRFAGARRPGRSSTSASTTASARRRAGTARRWRWRLTASTPRSSPTSSSREGPAGVAKRIARNVARALRHGA